MNPIPIWLGAAVLLGSLAAQDPPSAKPDVETRWLAFLHRQQQILVDWQKAVAEAQKGAEAARKDGKPVPAAARRPDFSDLRREVLVAAAEYPEDRKGRLCVLAYELSAESGDYEEVLDLMVREHLADETLAEIGPSLSILLERVGVEKAAAALARIEAGAKHPRVLGWLAYARYGKTIGSAAPDSEAFQTAKKALLAVVERAGDARLTDDVNTELAEKERFAVGMTAPDIEGLDLDGVAFKLSDYRGKVVFLDFWGDW